MYLSKKTIKILSEIICGDYEILPYLTGRELVRLFNQFGIRDIYSSQNGGLPEKISRLKYTEKSLLKINDTEELKKLMEAVIISERFFKYFDVKESISKINNIIKYDGYQFEKIFGGYEIKNINPIQKSKKESEISFSNNKIKIIEALRKAEFNIWVAVAWFTDKDLWNELYKKYKEGLEVRVIIIDDHINSKAEIPSGKYFNVLKIKPKGKNIMHYKFCIIDLKTVIHGSYNWTDKANYNSETIHILEEEGIVEDFMEEFKNLFRKNI